MTDEQRPDDVAIRFEVEDVFADLSGQLASALKDNAILRAALKFEQSQKSAAVEQPIETPAIDSRVREI